jgi:hypothetical protein
MTRVSGEPYNGAWRVDRFPYGGMVASYDEGRFARINRADYAEQRAMDRVEACYRRDFNLEALTRYFYVPR